MESLCRAAANRKAHRGGGKGKSPFPAAGRANCGTEREPFYDPLILSWGAAGRKGDWPFLGGIPLAVQIRRLGGFAGLNTGSITDSYSDLRLRQGKGRLAGGFAGENQGELLRCVAQGRVTGGRQRHGLCGLQKGLCSDSFWLRRGREDRRRWADWDASLPGGSLEQALAGWDLEKVWLLENGARARLSLRDQPGASADRARVVELRGRQDLLDLAARVERGEDGPDVLYRLVADVDLGGREWAPIGADPTAPFLGCFDGGGHQIRNFVVKAGRWPYAGFFGFVGRGALVTSLNVDCVVAGKGSCAGGLCAVNDGTILNCTAAVRCDVSRCTGGLVGRNSGVVERCGAVGRIGRPFPWWLATGLLALLALLGPLLLYLASLDPAREVFAPVIIDPNAKPTEPEQEAAVIAEPEVPEEASASFIMNAEMYVSSANYAGAAGLRCPAWSTRGFVATVGLTGEDLQRAGYTGGEEYAVLYQSGLILPGYGVDTITLGPLPDGRPLPAGEYELSVLLEFYDTETYEKAAVNTVVPLKTTVG